MQDVAAACIFLATKTEECGRKLRDVAKVYCAKVYGRKNVDEIPDDSKVRHTDTRTERLLICVPRKL